MRIQPKDFIELIKASGEGNSKTALESVSMFCAILNSLKEGQSVEFDDFSIVSLGEGVFKILFDIERGDIVDIIKNTSIRI